MPFLSAPPALPSLGGVATPAQPHGGHAHAHAHPHAAHMQHPNYPATLFTVPGTTPTNVASASMLPIIHPGDHILAAAINAAAGNPQQQQPQPQQQQQQPGNATQQNANGGGSQAMVQQQQQQQNAAAVAAAAAAAAAAHQGKARNDRIEVKIIIEILVDFTFFPRQF